MSTPLKLLSFAAGPALVLFWLEAVRTRMSEGRKIDVWSAPG